MWGTLLDSADDQTCFFSSRINRGLGVADVCPSIRCRDASHAVKSRASVQRYSVFDRSHVWLDIASLRGKRALDLANEYRRNLRNRRQQKKRYQCSVASSEKQAPRKTETCTWFSPSPAQILSPAGPPDRIPPQIPKKGASQRRQRKPQTAAVAALRQDDLCRSTPPCRLTWVACGDRRDLLNAALLIRRSQIDSSGEESRLTQTQTEVAVQQGSVIERSAYP